jgi:4-carboxymuconolactone decarboxylase
MATTLVLGVGWLTASEKEAASRRQVRLRDRLRSESRPAAVPPLSLCNSQRKPMSSETSAADQLHRVARGQLATVRVLERLCPDALAASGLDEQTYHLVQIAALIATEGSPVSWVGQLDAAASGHVELGKILGTLIAVAPIVGDSRVIEAATGIVLAEDLEA